MYKMTLADGTKIEFDGLNGTNLIAPDKEEMDTSVFTDSNLKTVTFIDDDGNEYAYENLGFIQQQKQRNGDYYICFYEKSPQEVAQDEIKSLLLQVAEIEVESGNLTLTDIEGSLQDAVRVKIDDDKRLDL